MVTKRIIPCLDIKNGRTVKGVNFKGLIDAGDPVRLAQKYESSLADELVFLDITATLEGRSILLDMVEQVALQISIPFAVGGGIRTVDDAMEILAMGADKICINSAAIQNPGLIREMADRFGSQSVVVAIDAKQVNKQWKVYRSGGTKETAWDLFKWAQKVEEMGAGEILFTSMDGDGTQSGFANDALYQLGKEVKIPIIASGGAGSVQDFVDVFTIGQADAALAASVFHFDKIAIPELKNTLREKQINVRL
jgi:cyclase